MLVTISNCVAILKKLEMNKGPVAIDTETRGLRTYHDGHMIGVSIYLPGEIDAWYFSFRHAADNLPDLVLKALYERVKNRTIVGFNYKYDAKVLERDGWHFPHTIEDVDLAFRIFDENQKKFGLKNLADKHLSNNSSKSKLDLQVLLKQRKLTMGNLDQLTGAEVDEYASQDALLTWRLYEFIMPHLERWRLVDYWRDLCRMSMIMAEMERNGIMLNRALVEQQSADCVVRIEDIKKRINEIAGFEINLNSPKQLKEWLKVPSTAAAMLVELAKTDPNIALLQDHRSQSKSNSTYYEAFKYGMDINDRLHCTFRVAGTVTGRMSCTEPNLQAIPRSGDEATSANAAKLKVKKVFMAPAGRVLIEADYSQLELRLTAHFCREDKWVQAYTEDLDLHTYTAAALFQIPFDQVTKSQRQQGKTMNFSVLYGAGKPRIMNVFKVSECEAEKLIKNFWEPYPKLKKFAFLIRQEAKSKRYLRLFTGRVRRFQYVWSEEKQRMQDTSWDALNSLIQGTGAETTRLAIMKIHDRLKLAKLDAMLVLTVHDSIVVESACHCVTEVVELVREAMQDNPWCSIQLLADIKVKETLG